MIELDGFPVLCIMTFSAIGFSVLFKLVKMVISMTGRTILRQSGEFLLAIPPASSLKWQVRQSCVSMRTCQGEMLFLNDQMRYQSIVIQYDTLYNLHPGNI